MQLFRSEEDIESWSQATGHPRGAPMSPATLWELARRWYSNRLELGWQRRTVEERQAILTEVGLTGSFWDLASL